MLSVTICDLYVVAPFAGCPCFTHVAREMQSPAYKIKISLMPGKGRPDHEVRQYSPRFSEIAVQRILAKLLRMSSILSGLR
jgi:hypothetical protein